MSAVFKQRRVTTIEVDASAAKKKLGQLIREAREDKNMTQQQLSQLLNIGRSQVASLETGRTWCGIEQFIKLIYLLELEISAETFS